MTTRTIMAYTVLCFMVCGFFAAPVDSAIEKWTSPVIETPIGTAVDPIAISENEPVGTSVFTVEATSKTIEADLITYAIGKQPLSNVFESVEGIIRTTAPLDFEEESSYVIEVTANDGTTGKDGIGTATITINVENVGPIFEQSSLSVCVQKGSTADTVSGEFAIDADSGEVTVKAGANLIDGQLYDLTVEASVGNEKDTMILKITGGECPSDVNETPKFDKASETLCLKQGSSPGTYVSTLTANDPEKEKLSYYLTGSGHTDFKINENGTISVSSLSQEITKYELTVLASDTNGNGTMKLTIDVGDCSESGVSSPITAVGVFAPLLLLALYFN